MNEARAKLPSNADLVRAEGILGLDRDYPRRSELLPGLPKLKANRPLGEVKCRLSECLLSRREPAPYPSPAPLVGGVPPSSPVRFRGSAKAKLPLFA